MNDPLTPPDPWHTLTRYTAARIGLGRTGSSLPTNAMLDFSMSHAHARDAIHTPLDTDQLARQLHAANLATITIQSQATSRAEYLRRPDLGRALTSASISALHEPATPRSRLTIVVADGLSSLAPARHALPLIVALRPYLIHWQLDTIILATQARVALGDHIGSLRKSELVLVLIGERPGLKAADSLGAYLTWHPHIGRTDAERNCISNIRPQGLSCERAIEKLLYLFNGARTLQATGVALKDDSGSTPMPLL